MNIRQSCSALLAALLIAGYAISASCQSEPEITDFHPFTTLTWTNLQTNTYCDIEWVCNLNHEWIGSGSSLLTTQEITSVDIDGFQFLMEQVQWLLRNADPDNSFAGLFFRVVSSEQLIQPHVFTNTLRFSNVSTSILENVTFGLKRDWSYVPLTNIPTVLPMTTTDVVQVWAQFPYAPPISGPIDPVGNGWYVSYDHDGSNRISQSEVIPIGPIEKNILLTVSNNSLTIEAEWLRLTRMD